MNIAFYFKNLEPTDAIKEYCKEKVGKIKDRLHHIEAVDVRFKLLRQNQVCEITVHADATVFHVQKQDKDLYASIDAAVDILNIQIDKYHKKIGEKSTAFEAMPTRENELSKEDHTIQVYQAPVKPMTDLEAILQLQSEKFKFHMYHHIEEKRYSMVFARPDGNYSLISPTKELGQYEEKIVKMKENSLKDISYSLYPLSILSVSEAIEQRNENNLEYLAFVNEESRRLNVLFISKNGELALKKPL
ncbi:MAG: ribosome-associated translation inhibitor RaiA [Spirochaetia bacterium]|nr:ribosome-associated translation inhibitor RaiA [Spirochaetia bacterium]